MLKKGSKFRMILAGALILIGSLGLWAYLAQQALADEAALAEAKAIEEANKRYPVKGRIIKEPVAPLPPPASGPAEVTERPRTRIHKAEE
jgi:hypothetical protein